MPAAPPSPSGSGEVRPGETVLDLAPATDAVLRFIGRVETPFATRAECPRQGRLDGPVCRLVLDPVWEPALDGIDVWAHLEVLYWLDRARRDLVTQSPRGPGMLRGTFALRSPVRPNPIGTARVALVGRRGRVLEVRGLDCIDGTPLLDIKPERCAYSPQAPEKAADRPVG